MKNTINVKYCISNIKMLMDNYMLYHHLFKHNTQDNFEFFTLYSL